MDITLQLGNQQQWWAQTQYNWSWLEVYCDERNLWHRSSRGTWLEKMGICWNHGHDVLMTRWEPMKSIHCTKSGCDSASFSMMTSCRPHWQGTSSGFCCAYLLSNPQTLREWWRSEQNLWTLGTTEKTQHVHAFHDKWQLNDPKFIRIHQESRSSLSRHSSWGCWVNSVDKSATSSTSLCVAADMFQSFLVYVCMHLYDILWYTCMHNIYIYIHIHIYI